ncbi:MAG: DNA repair protein RadC [Bifidobacteriaceae bacterium]|jgi:DNA repair protein RadC|nr:DNA repair protein RadC [Bifidobacteriaceae bacterium]
MTVRMMDVPVDDRPRERLLRQGTSALSDAELVAVQLGSGHRGASALDVAHQILAEWGGMAGLASARPEELARTPGVGQAKAARLAASFALAARMAETGARPVLRTSEDIALEAGKLIARSRVEQVVVLAADGANRLVRAEVVATGSAKSCPVPVREILATALRHDAVAFAIAHNHPSGDPAPTPADAAATDAVRAAADAVGLRFLEHVVIAGSTWRGVRRSAVDIGRGRGPRA